MTPISECRLRATSASTSASLTPTRPRTSEKRRPPGSTRIDWLKRGSGPPQAPSRRRPRREDGIEGALVQDLVPLELVAESLGVIPPVLPAGRLGEGLPPLRKPQAAQDLAAVRSGSELRHQRRDLGPVGVVLDDRIGLHVAFALERLGDVDIGGNGV